MEAFGAFGVPGSGIIFSLIIGGIAGWIAEQVMKGNHSLLTNILFGCIGSIVGWWIVGLLGISIFPGILNNLIVATLGAMLLIFVYRKVKYG
ncbi:MAG: GlsB/YeaQ/YmgE family stress response membrane protein [Pseudomonadota bacterium]